MLRDASFSLCHFGNFGSGKPAGSAALLWMIVQWASAGSAGGEGPQRGKGLGVGD